MSSPEMRCPSCNVILNPASDRPGLLECPSCHTLYSPQPASSSSAMDVITVVLLGLGKLILILAGLVALGLGLLFAGCLLASRFH